jgi:formate hydrogenlyase subunit 3/multisubunit Na+/H+ antiporter MnhD subunit
MSDDYEPKRNPAAGAALGAMSAAKNKKLMMVIGGILIAIGIAGMVFIGSQVKAIINSGQWGNVPANGFWYQMVDYAFLFTMIAGFVLVLYAQVSLQREGAKRREAEDERRRRQADAAGAA